MKTLLITAATGVLLLSGGMSILGNTQASADKGNDHIETYQTNHETENEDNGVTPYTEYTALDNQIKNVEDYEAKVVANNPHKRVILFSDDNDAEQFKSVFIKDTNRLKIIDLHNGQIFNQVLKGSNHAETGKESDASENKNEVSDNAKTDDDDFPEFDTLEDAIDADDDDVRIVTDNPHKRIMFVKGEDNEKQYKSILIKDTKRLKIIDLHEGQVFNQVIE